VAFKDKSSNDDCDDVSYASTDDDVASMVEWFKKFMKKKGYHGVHNKSGKSYGKNPFAKKKYFECGEIGHISTNYKKNEENSSTSKKFEGKKNIFKKYNKKKNGKACYVEWDSDAISDSSSNDDDDVKPSKKGLVDIDIKDSPYLFDTPYCLMAKAEPKVCDDDEFSYDDLVEMVSNLDDLLGDMKWKYRDLKKKHASLQDSYEEIKASHENLLETHEKLKKGHNLLSLKKSTKWKLMLALLVICLMTCLV
jgi:hypothetical protein